jgi:hypothetical protein
MDYFVHLIGFADPVKIDNQTENQVRTWITGGRSESMSYFVAQTPERRLLVPMSSVIALETRPIAY